MSPLHKTWLAAWLGLLGACAPGRQVLVETTGEGSASEVIVNLGEFGIPARKQKGEGRDAGWIVTVPENELHKAHKILLTLGLPRERHAGLESMLADTGVIPSKTNEHARLVYATSEELAATLEEHEQVIGARVHIVLPEDSIGDRIGSDRPKRPTASVLLRYVPGSGIEMGEDEAGAAGARTDDALERTQFQDAYQETLDQVFADIAANADGKLQALLRDLVRDSIGSVQQPLVDRAERIVGQHLSNLRTEVEARLEELAEEHRNREDRLVLKSEVAALRKELEESLRLLGEQMTAGLRDDLNVFFGEQTSVLGGDFERKARASMDQLVKDRTSDSHLATTLGITQDEPVEVTFFKLMLQDFYSLPQTIRLIAERRTQEDPPGLPYASDDVRMLVAHAVEGMWPWDVNVVFSPIDRPAIRARSAEPGSGEIAAADLPEPSGPDLTQFEGAGERNELEAKNARLLYLALALGATTLLLLVLLTRERSRNTSLRRELAAATA